VDQQELFLPGATADTEEPVAPDVAEPAPDVAEPEPTTVDPPLDGEFVAPQTDPTTLPPTTPATPPTASPGWDGDDPSGLSRFTPSGVTTRIVRIDLADQDLSLAAQGTVPGALINQFALDEHDGHLRVVTTVDGMDQALGAWTQRVTLRVLDAALQQVGAVELVRDESVRAVRFAATVGYVVTFKQVDPLFAVDLSRPEAPTVMSALKIPGFSSYLHPWGDGRLAGLGVNADENGWQDGLKLSMFNTADPYNVTETHALKVAADESIALNDHRAVWADLERGLIGFPAYQWSGGEQPSRYLVYSVDDAGQFSLRADLPLSYVTGYWGTPATRGVQIGDHLYVCSAAAVTVFSLATFDQVAELEINATLANGPVWNDDIVLY
jgi:uncharacterized secreted protein with C-terminal beta-propeller domain